MNAATAAVHRPPSAKLLVVDKHGSVQHWARSDFPGLLRAGDLVIANDAATLPASLEGVHERTGEPIEVRLAGRDSVTLDEITQFTAVVFGAGDFYIRTEDRPLPPALRVGDRLALGPLVARVKRVLGHPRLVLLQFLATPAEIWEGLARHGRPIQYSHLKDRLAIWDTWTSIAGPPVAFEAPSAGFMLDWTIISSLQRGGIRFETLTHAAGISSTGDASLDALLPFPEPYRIPAPTVKALEHARAEGGRVIAIGTTVVRALEHAARDGWIREGEGLATQRIGPSTALRVVDAILSGGHEPGTSHYELLRAFVPDETLRRADHELEAHGYLTHEFGDSVYLERSRVATRDEVGLEDARKVA